MATPDPLFQLHLTELPDAPCYYLQVQRREVPERIRRFDSYEFKVMDRPRDPPRKPGPLPPPGLWTRLFGMAGYRAKLREHEEKYQKKLAWYDDVVKKWEQDIAEARRKWQERLTAEEQSVEAWNAQIDSYVAEFLKDYVDGRASGLAEYFQYSTLPIKYPSEYLNQPRPDESYVDLSGRLTCYVEEARLLVIDRDPVPPAPYVFRTSRDEPGLDERRVTVPDLADAYLRFLCSLALLRVREVFTYDTLRRVDECCVTLETFAEDPATGDIISIPVLSVRIGREAFSQLHLSGLDPVACVRRFGARITPKPAAVPPPPVTPFVTYPQALERDLHGGALAASIDLVSMDPYAFEHLIGDLLERMGYDTTVTQSSRDGGIDVIAVDPRPITGGKIVVQVKRYSNTVGVSAVRDLFGTMTSEGANKGILITTSGFGPDAHAFAAGKPMELIGGTQLLSLLHEHGFDAHLPE